MRLEHITHVKCIAVTVISTCLVKHNTELPSPPNTTTIMDVERISTTNPGESPTYGRTYDEQRFSPLDKIDVGNVSGLGLAWAFDLDTPHRVQESTPLVLDGVMYVTSAWSKLFALDAKTGRQKWMFDPKVPGEAG